MRDVLQFGALWKQIEPRSIAKGHFDADFAKIVLDYYEGLNFFQKVLAFIFYR